MKTNKKTLNTHTLVRRCFVTFSVKLVIGCLVMVVTFAGSTTEAEEFSNQPVASSIGFPSTESSDGNYPDKISELGGDDDQALVADRPGKPDSHNSNGDDVVVRPVR
jgi:hypothetical protein